MASYKVVFKPSVEKDLRALPQSVVARVVKQVEVLQQDPRPRGTSKLVGAEQLYRVRIGDYRMVYGIDKDGGKVIVYYIRHRREAYRHL